MKNYRHVLVTFASWSLLRSKRAKPEFTPVNTLFIWAAGVYSGQNGQSWSLLRSKHFLFGQLEFTPVKCSFVNILETTSRCLPNLRKPFSKLCQFSKFPHFVVLVQVFSKKCVHKPRVFHSPMVSNHLRLFCPNSC